MSEEEEFEYLRKRDVSYGSKYIKGGSSGYYGPEYAIMQINQDIRDELKDIHKTNKEILETQKEILAYLKAAFG